MNARAYCVHCGETRRTWSLWRQILDLGRPLVCCLPEEGR